MFVNFKSRHQHFCRHVGFLSLYVYKYTRKHNDTEPRGFETIFPEYTNNPSICHTRIFNINFERLQVCESVRPFATSTS